MKVLKNIEYLNKFETLIEDVFDFHFEETEVALFTWTHTDTDESPIDIKNSLMPQYMIIGGIENG